MNPWDRIKHELEAKLSPESYQNWIGRTSFARLEGTTLSVTAPDESTKRWMESEYAAQVTADRTAAQPGHRARGV